MTFKGKCCKHFCRRLCVVFALIILFPLSVQSAESPKEKIAFADAAISPSMAGVWMAKESGAFDRRGLSVDLVHISYGAVASQALVGGSVQAALGASNAVLAATIKGAPIIAVGSNTSRPGMQLWVQPEIQRPEQLQGKTLAITRFGSTSEFVTRLILRKLNLEGKPNCGSLAASSKPIWVFAPGRRKAASPPRRRLPKLNCWSMPPNSEFHSR